MNRTRVILLLVIFAVFHPLGAEETTPEAKATLVVYNSRDPVSWDLANYYADKRHIPKAQVVGVECSIEEEITRAEYDRDIAEPLRKIFTERGWWKLTKISEKEIHLDENKIRFVALMRGMPLKIQSTTAYPGDEQTGPPQYSSKNEASVDSELACLGFFSRVISGAITNPYYHVFTRITDANLPQLMLVCRLDAPTADVVRRMIDDAIEAEHTGLWGFAYIDSRNIKEGGLAEGDKWLLSIAEDAKKHGIPIVHDNGPGLFPDNYPMRYAAFYYGWYAENACGPFAQPGFQFTKGAVACHIHSFSAASLRNPEKNWAAPLLEHGAAAVIGNVYEPFLALTANLDVFHGRLEDGFTFAESAYMSLKVVSWMSTNIGDPLYKPFKIIEENPRGLPKPMSELAAYRIGAQTWFKKDPVAGEKSLIKSGRELRSGIIFESLGQLQAGESNFLGALSSFQQARVYYSDGDDIIRTALHEVSILRMMHKESDAHAIAQKILRVFSSSPSASLLQKLDNEMGTPTPRK